MDPAIFFVGLISIAGSFFFGLLAHDKPGFAQTIACGVLSLMFFLFGALVWLGADVVGFIGMRRVDAFAQSEGSEE